jgi:hypothetical protein
MLRAIPAIFTPSVPPLTGAAGRAADTQKNIHIVVLHGFGESAEKSGHDRHGEVA